MVVLLFFMEETMADENVGLDLASQTGQEDIVEAINGLKNLLSRLSDLLTLGSKTVTQNGIYNPADDGFDGYSQVDVDIQLYTNDTTYESEVKIDDVSGFTKLYSTTIPYGSSGSKVSTQLSVTDENSIETLMNNGWESGASYDSEDQIGAYAGYSFGRNANITKCKIWLGRYSGQNQSLFVTVQYLNTNDEWVDLETLDISTTIPYPVNMFEVTVGRTVKGIRWIHKDQPQKSASNNTVFFGMILYENVSGSEGVNVYKPSTTGLIVPPEGYAGFGNLLINDGGSGNVISGVENPESDIGNNGYIYLKTIKHGVDLSQFVNTNESSMTLAEKTSTRIQYKYTSGGSIGARAAYQIDLTDVNEITIQLKTGANSYNSYQTGRFAPFIYIATSDRWATDADSQSGIGAQTRLNQPNSEKTVVVDVSNYTGTYYVIFNGTGCDCSLEYMLLDGVAVDVINNVYLKVNDVWQDIIGSYIDDVITS